MLTAISFIFIISLGGFALTYLLDADEPQMWRIMTGTVIGQCVFGTSLFFLTFASGLSYGSIFAAAAISLFPLFLLKKRDRRKLFDRDWAKAKGKLQGAKFRKLLPFLYYFGFFVFFILFFDRAMMETAEGIFTGGSNNLGDLPFHLGIIFSFTDGANFPPQNPSFAGTKFSYPFVADLGAAALVRLGAGVREAMLVQNVSWAFSLLIILERFVLMLVKDRLSGRIAPLIFFLSGGLGFLWFFSDYAAQSKNIVQLLLDIGKDYTITDQFRWGNSLITLFLTQRSLLMGMPLTMIVIGGLWKIFSAARQNRSEIKERMIRAFTIHHSPFILGLLAGMLPLIHLHSLLVLFVVSGFLLALRMAKWREFAVFGVGVCVIAVPELIWSITGSASRPSEFFSFYFGWESSHSNIVWAWLKNTGILIPMILTGLYLFFRYRKHDEADERPARKRTKSENKAHDLSTFERVDIPSLLRFYIPFAFLFILANLVKLAPWEWDNIKVLIYWFVASIPFAAIAFTRLWEWKGIARAVSVIALFALTASGGLDVWRTVSRQHNYRVFDPDAVKIGERLRLATPPGSIFLNAPTYNSAIVLSGRLSLMRYPGHLGSHGINYQEREEAVKQMYRGGPIATALFKKYGIDYVIVSPEERSTLTPNDSFFSRFPVTAEFGQYKVYDVRPRG